MNKYKKSLKKNPVRKQSGPWFQYISRVVGLHDVLKTSILVMWGFLPNGQGTLKRSHRCQINCNHL